MKTKSFLILLCMLISSFGQVFAYTVGNGQSTEGKDFWVTFMQADQDPNNSLVLSLSIAAREDCQVTICNPYTGYSEVVSVSANQLHQVELYNGNVLGYNARAVMETTGKVCYAVNSEKIDTCALHVTATEKISLFATNYKRATFDATNVLPTPSLLDEYIIQTYTPSDHGNYSDSDKSRTQGSHFAIIAAEDNTIVDYCPTVPTEAINSAISKYQYYGGVGMTDEEVALANWKIGDTIHSPVLNAGQVFYVWTGKKDKDAGDLSGTYVKARDGKKIAVFQGCPHTNIPYQTKERDHIFSQAMPITEWGETFVLTASAGRHKDYVRILALNDGTEVRINGNLVHTFDFANTDKKQYWEFTIGDQGTYAQNGSCVVTTSCPCATHLFLASKKADNVDNGDPAMLWVNPIEQQIDQVTFATYSSTNGTTANYVNVVTDQPNLMTLDGTSIASEFSPVSGSSTYYFARVSLGDTATSHTLQSNGSKFIAHVYGFTANESYGYSVGGILNKMAYNVTVNYDETKGNVIARLNRGGSLCTTGGDYLKAIPNEGFRFLQWNDGNTDNPRYIYLTQDTTFTALFTEINYTISVTCDSTRGIIDGESGVFSANTELTYTAIPKYGYHFEHWSDYWWNTSNPRTILVDSDVSIEAIFAPNKYSISALNNPNGEVTGIGSFDYLTECAISAIPHYGYHFTKWNDGNTDNPRTIILTQDTTFAAEYTIERSGKCGDNMALTWSYDPISKSLTIIGNGALNSNYTFGIEAPNYMEKLIIAEGVTSVGQSAFANQTTLQEISLPTTVKTVGEQAFYNCTGLTQIYNYRERPCVAYSNSFDGIDKFDCTLHVLSASIDMYKAATAWRDFYYIQTIDAQTVTETDEEVSVDPGENSAEMTWPAVPSAITYSLTISKGGVVFCTLIFDEQGHLKTIDFAAPALRSNEPQTQPSGFRFTVTGLNSGTQYAYSIDAKDASSTVLDSKTGHFTTLTGTALEEITNHQSQITNQKLLHNGQIYILRDGKVFDLSGRKL